MKKDLGSDKYFKDKEDFQKEFADRLSTFKSLMNNDLKVASMMLSSINKAIINNPKLLKCTKESFFGAVNYFAELQLPFDTAEGYGYILIEKIASETVAVPLLGYKGMIELAYRNPSMKQIRIQSVYEKDSFEYAYGTEDYIKHQPYMGKESKGELIAVYAVAKIQNLDPLFVVVTYNDLREIEKQKPISSLQDASFDVFNIMQAKIALKLLFKMLPKEGNSTLMKAMELDDKFDYMKNFKIKESENGYEVEKTAKAPSKKDVLATSDVGTIRVAFSEKFKEESNEKQNQTLKS